MLMWTIVKVALESLRANKLRSLLAVLGIIIGVGAVISMLALGAGAEQQVMERVSSMGTNLLTVRPGQSGSRGVMSGIQETLSLEDAEAIVREVPGIQAVAPVVRGNAQLKYTNKNTRSSLVGSALTYLAVRNFVPYTVAMQQILGIDHLQEISIQMIETADNEQVEREVSGLLRKRHRLQPDADDDFEVRNQAEMLEHASSISQTFTLLLGGIASISLLVGGIGIMNIMLVTVTERTREIGVRKAIGAKDRDVLRQFLLEAILMSGTGGLLGVALGVGVAQGIAGLTGFSAVVRLTSVLVALSFSATVGVFFGYYPARRAAQLDPIEALRYE